MTILYSAVVVVVWELDNIPNAKPMLYELSKTSFILKSVAVFNFRIGLNCHYFGCCLTLGAQD